MSYELAEFIDRYVDEHGDIRDEYLPEERVTERRIMREKEADRRAKMMEHIILDDSVKFDGRFIRSLDGT